MDALGSSVSGAGTLEACQAACALHPSCEGIVITHAKPTTCYRKKNVQIERCDRSHEFDMYVLLPPSPPPMLPPPPPPPPVPPLTVVQRLNWRFHSGEPTNSLEKAGILIHQACQAATIAAKAHGRRIAPER